MQKLSNDEREKFGKYMDNIEHPVCIVYTDKNNKSHYDYIGLETIRNCIKNNKFINPFNRQSINASNIKAVDTGYLKDLEELLEKIPTEDKTTYPKYDNALSFGR